MDSRIYLITVIFAVIISIAIHQRWNKLPLTMIQIVLGGFLGLTPIGRGIEFKPELFILLIIVPLLYIEGERTDILDFWRAKKPIINMAFLSVFIIVFAVGVFTHRLFPSIPIAACFALGAILGPTDMTAVTSLSGKISFSERNLSLLKGEGLINDASGVTALQFAVIALLTGSFSPAQAGIKLVVTCFGGILIGYLLAAAKKRLLRYLGKHSAANTSLFILIEMIMPFLCYMAAEECGVSGILAVVVAGCVSSMSLKKAVQFEAEFDATKNTLWDMLVTILESLAFLFLGMQLPGLMLHINDSGIYSSGYLAAAILMVYFLLFIVRFLCAFLFTGNRADSCDGYKVKLKDAAIISLSGVKGVISLAAAFSLPNVLEGGEPFGAKGLLLFMTAGIIIISLLSALIFLPFAAGSAEKDNTLGRIQLMVLREAITRLEKQKACTVEKEYNSVILNYWDRIAVLEYNELGKKERKDVKALRRFMLNIELLAMNQSYKQKKISAAGYRKYSDLLLRIQQFENNKMLFKVKIVMEGLKKILLTAGKPMVSREERVKQEDEEIWGIFLENNKLVLESLEHLRAVYSAKAIELLLEERRNLQQMISAGNYLESLWLPLNRSYGNYLLIGYEMERNIIREQEKEGKLTFWQANQLRRNVNGLESFVINDKFNYNIYRILDKR